MVAVAVVAGLQPEVAAEADLPAVEVAEDSGVAAEEAEAVLAVEDLAAVVADREVVEADLMPVDQAVLVAEVEADLAAVDRAVLVADRAVAAEDLEALVAEALDKVEADQVADGVDVRILICR